MPPGRLITIEGIDGAGKSTLAERLLPYLVDRVGDARLLREPGGVEASERIRALVKDSTVAIGARAEALLYAAARAQLVDEALRPLLKQGTWVLLDRFVDSSLAYQGAARGLGVGSVRAINHFATGDLTPDLTLLLRISPAEARRRAVTRGEEPDRLEQEDDGFFKQIAAAYDDLARAEPERIRVFDAEQPSEVVLAAAQAAVLALVGRSGPPAPSTRG